jgi:hypothetical protein
MSVALVPAVKDTAHLLFRWQNHEAATEVRFLRRTRTRVTNTNGRPNEPVNRGHFDEANPRLVRAMHLSELNYTGLVLPAGKVVALWYPRLGADASDFAALTKAAEGEVIALMQSPPLRMRTDIPLQVAGRAVETGNLTPGFHGSYSLWLRRSKEGWRLVFSGQPDVWGSQHDPEADKLDVPLTHSESGEPSRPFGAALMTDGPEAGQLRLHWGPHDWTVPLQFVTTR